MKILRIVLLTLLLAVSSLVSPTSKLHAVSIKPQPPFSEEGNPDEAYQFDAIFPLFRYIAMPKLEIYENLDRSRNYEPLKVCPGAGADRRDYYCDNQGDGCDGGEVDICHNTLDNHDFAYTTTSNNGSCNLFSKPEEGSDELIEGKCDYSKRPDVKKDVKGTDFSTGKLVYPKLQSESLAYDNVGDPTNPITYGSSFLNSDACEIAIRQLLVLQRAKLTKATLNQTGEWPLGWVDFGYHTTNGKTLIQIHDELPGNITGPMNGIVEGIDDFFLNAGNLEAVSDISGAKQNVCVRVAEAYASPIPAEWTKDLAQSPLYPPSWRQGFTRPSICVWNKCCPGIKCELSIEELGGTKRGLYFDASISQTFGAALDSLLMNYSLEEASRVFRHLAIANPLIRFATGASPNAIPSEIHKRLDAEISDRCRDIIGWSNFLAFGTRIDYLDEGAFRGPNDTCPDYSLQPELTKEYAAAYFQSPLKALINLIWGRREDDVNPVKYHFITVPDAMGQSIQEIQQTVYDTRDTLAELEAIKDYNTDMSNTVEDDGEGLYGGKSLGPADAKRRLGYYTCNDDMFSAQKATGIEAYALGTRIGCDQAEDAVPEGKCDGQLFAKLIEGSKYQETSPKGTEYFNAYIKGNLTPELMNTYAKAEKETGVPCEILAGIHFVEAGNSPDGSLVSGRKLGTAEPDAGGKVFHSLIQTAIHAGEELKGKVGGNIGDAETAITALSRYNGGGNSNCQLGYPYPIPYGGCPRAFEGEDDPYPVSFVDAKHDSMFLLYCADRTACVPQIFERPGSFTVALNVYNSMTKTGYKNADLPPKQQKPATPATSQTSGSTTGSTGFFPKSCGPQSLSTALGCIPYTREAFVSALLTFIVGIAGAIALFTMLAAVFQIMTSASDAKKLQAGRELFFSAVAGLLFLIFSVSLLRIIAGNIIKLPGF